VVRDPSARAFLGYLLAWHVAVGLSASFFSFHMLANLKMGFVLAAAHGIAVCVVRIVAAPVWGRIVDRFGARPVLVVCSFGISVVPAIWLFPTPERLWPIALEAIVSGALWSGHGIAGFDLSIGLSPRKARPFYLATFATACGLGFAASSIVAALLAQSLTVPLHVLGSSWSNVHVLFLLSALARAGAAVLSLRIEEPAARGVSELVRVLVTPHLKAAINSSKATIWPPRVEDGTRMTVLTPVARHASTPSRTSLALPNSVTSASQRSDIVAISSRS